MRCICPSNATVVAHERSTVPCKHTQGIVVRSSARPNQNLESSLEKNIQLETSNLVRIQRREALQAVLTGIVTVGTCRPSLAASRSDSREGEIRHTDPEWRQILTADQYAVLRTAATERRFSSPLVDEHRKGVFVCAGCDAPLFDSSSKYESGTGWPSFNAAFPGAVDETRDDSIPFMTRTEVRCHRCQGHLGHVFPDGPEPTGLRYCMNGAALVFKPKA